MFNYLETKLLLLAHSLPLEWFVLLASFIEEVIAPIPSLAVLLTTGSFAAIQGKTILTLIPLVLLAVIGKTIGSIIVYYFSNKIGDLTIIKLGKFFNINRGDLELLRNKITNTKKDYLLLTLFRAIPIVPSAIVSVGCGVLKIPLRIFIFSTVIGSLIRDGITIYVGYTGLKILHSIATSSATVESNLQTILITIVILSLAYLYIKQKKLKSAAK
ncbi:MAG: hypothetical protein RLZZ230_471 [Candidatus Parcubacteria bacterium]|jgi:membrane protein DedA with SNARE-associated domain